jgi:dihydroorotate dehydrogenase (fumarate)
MDLSTTFMGLKLPNPFIVSSSKLTGNIIDLRKCLDHGAGAVVLKSLFEEQLIANSNKLMDQDPKYFWYPEAVEFINEHSKDVGVGQYLKLISDTKKHATVPVIASINCITPTTWPQFAKSLVDAGADAIELNIAIFPSQTMTSSDEIEKLYLEIVKAVRANVNVPVAVKLGPLFTNIIQMITMLSESGMNGAVLFNRFFRPDIDTEIEAVKPPNFLSAPEEMGQPLRFISLLSSKVKCDIAGNTGIHDAEAAIKMLLVGASAVQVCSTLYKNGIGYLDTLIHDLEKWMIERGYESIDQFKGNIVRYQENSLAFERLQFLKTVLSDY